MPRKSQLQTWYETIKRELLVAEPKNILIRSECCAKVINDCITSINIKLDLPHLSTSQEYSCTIDPLKHLEFLLNWPGLRLDNSPKAPKTKKEYEKKSKNWLNGRRAPNYGRTLFPFFIHEAENYISSTSKKLIKNERARQKLYYNIVIYKVLAKLCAACVTLNQQAKKAPFFCKNSIERKGLTKEILQSYASDHQYIHGFPSCFEEAIGYFDGKSDEYFNKYKSEYLEFHKVKIEVIEIDDDEDEDDKDSTKDEQSESMANVSRIAGGADAEYWKKQFMNVRRELAEEKQMRIRAERERDNAVKIMKNLISGLKSIHDDSLDSSSTISMDGSLIPPDHPSLNNNNIRASNDESETFSTMIDTMPIKRQRRQQQTCDGSYVGIKTEI